MPKNFVGSVPTHAHCRHLSLMVSSRVHRDCRLSTCHRDAQRLNSATYKSSGKPVPHQACSHVVDTSNSIQTIFAIGPDHQKLLHPVSSYNESQDLSLWVSFEFENQIYPYRVIFCNKNWKRMLSSNGLWRAVGGGGPKLSLRHYLQSNWSGQKTQVSN